MPEPRPGGQPGPDPSVRALLARWLVLVATLTILHICGRGGLGRPSLTALSGSRTSSPPLETAMALVRLVALGVGAYLLLVLTVTLAGRALGHRPTVTLATCLTPPGLRSALALATAGAALTVTAGTAGAASPTPPVLRWTGPAPASATPAPLLRWTGPPAPTPPARPPRTSNSPPATKAGDSNPGVSKAIVPKGGDSRPAVPRSVSKAGVSKASVSKAGVSKASAPKASAPKARVSKVSKPGVSQPSASQRPAATRPAQSGQVRPPALPAGPAGYIVRPGDSFWTIAQARLRLGGATSPPDDERLVRYWRLLVQVNLRDLPVPGQPDLLFPGDRIVLPPPS